MFLINSEQKDKWFVSDRAFQYGDGCFTTVLVRSNELQHWQLHLARLQRDTKALAIENVDWNKLQVDLANIVQNGLCNNKNVVKILISRGIGGRGYSPINCRQPTVIISTHAYPEHYAMWQKQGITLALLKQRLSISSLASIKHLNRLEQVMLKHELEQLNADEGVACCMNGNVVETTSSNIFWRKKHVLYTPNLSLAGVLGTQRSVVIETAKKLGWQVEEIIAKPEVLFNADEIFICNALMELVPVRKLENMEFKDHSLCKQLMLGLD